MYISRVEIDYSNRRNLKILSSLKAYHSWVEEAFPDEFKSQTRSRKLWRIDRIGDKTYLLVVSQSKPDHKILEKYGVKGSSATKDYDPFLKSLKDGQKARFKIVLNPTVSIKEEKESTKRGKVIPLKSSDFAKYLLDRSEKNGFYLSEEDFKITERKLVRFKHTPKSKKINLDRVTYEGILTIKDRDLLVRSLSKGIGKKKAYGFGLLTLILDK